MEDEIGSSRRIGKRLLAQGLRKRKEAKVTEWQRHETGGRGVRAGLCSVL